MQRVDAVARILDAFSQASGVRDIWKKTREEDKTKANAIEEENRCGFRRVLDIGQNRPFHLVAKLAPIIGTLEMPRRIHG